MALPPTQSCDADFVIIGGGFFGCTIALLLRSLSERVILIEAEDELMTRASRVNQARVHSGYHYPRSFLTAARSKVLQHRFIQDFSDAIVDDFDMLYAIAAQRSKVSARRFRRMFEGIGAPIARASQMQRGLFDPYFVEDVFLCKEFAFDWSRLRASLIDRLDAAGVDIRFGERVESIAEANDTGNACLALSSGQEITGRCVLNVTYAGLNKPLLASGMAALPVKHEFAEIALIAPPPELDGLALTVMDGPFFSAMPYPAKGMYSLTHVRYTPRQTWIDTSNGPSAYEVANRLTRQTRWKHMQLDAVRYVPCMARAEYKESLFDVKTVLRKNERDDGRPILVVKNSAAPLVYSVMGAKVDNIYDLLEVLPTIEPSWRDADARYLFA